MANSLVQSLKAVFIMLGCVMVATLIYTVTIDGLPFRMELLTPWMGATLVDFYINVVPLAAWVSYKEANWFGAVIWVLLLVCLGSITTCTYITFQLFKLSAEESMHDPMYHLLLRNQIKSGTVHKRNSFQLLIARAVFGALGCLMLGTLVYTILTSGSPFRKELLTPWMTGTLIDFYINVVALSVWIGYKESSWIGAFAWIAGLICFGSLATCVYIVLQLFQLSPYDPIYFVLLNKQMRAESRYERTSG
ncbi:hypothetical protein Ancab_038614 [Ancistrocladus abbreviatus]